MPLKACEHPSFSHACPERFDYNYLDNGRLESIACSIKQAITADLLTPERNLVPGLRQALRYLAQHADLL